MSAPLLKRVKPPAFAEDEDTTDAGSDYETVCTSAQASDTEDGHARGLLSTGSSRRAAQAHRFRSALATIPGTPVNRKAPVSRPPGTWAARGAQAPQQAPPGLATMPTLLGATPPANVLATQAAKPTPAPVLATSAPKQLSLTPQKVCLPAITTAQTRFLDPSMPVKKKPISGLADSSSRLDKTAPLKKRVTSFFTHDIGLVMVA